MSLGLDFSVYDANGLIQRSFWYCDKLYASDEEIDGREDREQVPEEDANLIGSELANGRHAPVLDIDIPHRLVPSSTPGHSHLYFDVEVDWEDYKVLLEALARCGIIEEGYYSNALKREATFVRKPGVTKETDPDVILF